MTGDSARDEAVRTLQELGLKEYEARCFVALTRIDVGTAKEISEISEVPRTRVYDAIGELESAGLIFTQHGTPKQFRAVSIEEAARTLRRQTAEQIDALETNLQRLDPPEEGSSSARKQEVWSLNGSEAVQSRTEDDIAEADSEIMLLVVEESLLSDEVVDQLRSAADRGVSVVVGGATEAITERIRDTLPRAEVFETELEWLLGPTASDEVAISRVLLTDRERLLVGSFYPGEGTTNGEQAIFANGLENGVIVLLRRLLATGLPAAETPEPA